MSHPARLGQLAGHEGGAVLVMFAIFAPVAVLLAAFVIDTGNWFVHKRHLQSQADSAVLAAAQEFQPCIDANVYATAGQYGGAGSVTTPSGTVTSTSPLYNSQIGKTSPANIHELINSKKYYKQTSPVDATAEEKRPCEAFMVDAKITETNLPWYWRAFSTVPYINAHARVEILQQTKASGVEPLAVVESSPIAAEAYFVNEDSKNAIIAKTPLTNLGPNEQGQDVWANPEAPLAVALKATNATTAHIGVVIALSGKVGDTTCGDETVECFGQKSEKEKASLEKFEPLLHIAGYSNAGTATVEKPLARQVNLTAGTCTDAYFSTSASSCAFAISAKIDYGSKVIKGVEVKPEINGVKGAKLNPPSEGGGVWTGSATLPSGSGSNEVSLVFECKKETTSACPSKAVKETIKDVHRIYAASPARNGTISGAWLSEVGGLPQDADTFEVCAGCTHKLVVTVDVGGSLADAQKYSDPLYHMRFGKSQAEVVGCEPGKESSGSAYREHLARGCEGTFQINTADPNCTGKTEPFDCIGFASGVKTGPFGQGLEKRFESEPPNGARFYCANNWINSNSGGVPNLPKDDSRIIQLFIEPYDSNGSKSAPIQDFATFYATGWDGDRCNTKKPSHLDDEAGKGEIVGHFVKYVNTLNTEDGGGQKCNLNALGQCVAVLTR